MKLDYTAVGRRVKRFRGEKKLSQEKLAELVDISVPYMSYVESGKAKFGMQILLDLSNVLGVTPDELLVGYSGRRKETYVPEAEGIHREMEGCTTEQMEIIREVICYARQMAEQCEGNLSEQERECEAD